MSAQLLREAAAKARESGDVGSIRNATRHYASAELFEVVADFQDAGEPIPDEVVDALARTYLAT